MSCLVVHLSIYVSMLVGGNKERKEELWSSAKIMGIPEANVTIIM